MKTPADEAFVDASFHLSGKTLPLDHGYNLFASLSHLLPVIHEQRRWGVHPVLGVGSKQGVLELGPGSRLTIRLPAEALAQLVPLVGADLDVSGHAVRLGAMQVRPLNPAVALKSRLVTIKGFHGEPEEFREAVLRQLSTMAGSSEVAIGARRVLRIAGRRVVGFAVGVDGLSATESLRLQTQGIGGRRHHGAGLFVPVGRRG